MWYNIFFTNVSFLNLFLVFYLVNSLTFVYVKTFTIIVRFRNNGIFSSITCSSQINITKTHTVWKYISKQTLPPKYTTIIVLNNLTSVMTAYIPTVRDFSPNLQVKADIRQDVRGDEINGNKETGCHCVRLRKRPRARSFPRYLFKRPGKHI